MNRGIIVDGETIRTRAGKLVRYQPIDDDYSRQYGLALAQDIKPGVEVKFELDGDDGDSLAIELVLVPPPVDVALARLQAVGLLAGLTAPKKKSIDLLDVVVGAYCQGPDASTRRETDRVALLEARKASVEIVNELMDLAGARVLTALEWTKGTHAPTVSGTRTADGSRFEHRVEDVLGLVSAISAELHGAKIERGLSVLWNESDLADDLLVVMALTRPQYDEMSSLQLT
jgi:hypothetical protein